MRRTGDRLGFAPTDLGKFLACRRLTSISRAVALGEAPAPPARHDPRRDALLEAGRQHEDAVREAYLREGRAVVKIGKPDPEAQTRDAMRRGIEVIHQGRFSRDAFAGYPDFLERVARPSRFGGWSYEVVDAKLATIARVDAVLQIATYSWMLALVQGIEPEEMHLALGGGTRESFRTTDFAAFERTLRERFVEHCADPGVPRPEPVAFCPHCDWNEACERRRREDDALSLVAGTKRHQREKLERRGISTLTALARLPLPLAPPLDGVPPVTLSRIRRQAAAQLEGRRRGGLHHELTRPREGHGLLALPEPSPGDLFLVIERSRASSEGAWERHFGLVDRDGTPLDLQAFDPDGERRMFEQFMDLVAARRRRDPNLHIHHYGKYETEALKRLMSRYATREDEMDALLRRRVFVDLLQVVRQGMVASVERYTLEAMEPFHQREPRQRLPDASHPRPRIDRAPDRGERTAEDGEIVRRNREDCLSMLRLRQWLEARRAELVAEVGPQPRPIVDVSRESEARLSAAVLRVGAVADGIVAADPRDGARRLLAHVLDYPRREQKSAAWEFFRMMDLDAEGLIEDGSALGGLERDNGAERNRDAAPGHYRFPPQEHRVRSGFGVIDPATGESPGSLVEVSEGRLILRRGGRASTRPHPRALVPSGVAPALSLEEALLRLGEEVAAKGFAEWSRRRAAFDLLRRIPPRGGGPGEPLLRPGEGMVAGARRLALALDREVLPIQGPPGSGKTYLGARIVTALLAAGRRVGLTAQSHRVITNLLEAVARAADEEGQSFRGLQIAKRDRCGDPRVAVLPYSRDAERAAAGFSLIAGTAWVWTRPLMRDQVDVLVVDEAGQFSLASTLGCARAAGSLILLGDPRQLDQVTQGIHPEGSDASALGHLLGGEQTLAPDRGLFLPETWRMHPGICRFTSELFYEGRLGVRPGLEQMGIRGGPLPGAGLRFVPVEHEGNRRQSAEEAERIRALVERLLDDATWTDSGGVSRPLTRQDILVVAPYRAQVELLQRVLGENARVGTVDRFQGQEAPVVFYSMATSTPDAAPRGMDFLYSLNRLNVATSRARCLAAVVASPELLLPECRNPGQLRLANAFCRFQDLAREVR